ADAGGDGESANSPPSVPPKGGNLRTRPGCLSCGEIRVRIFSSPFGGGREGAFPSEGGGWGEALWYKISQTQIGLAGSFFALLPQMVQSGAHLRARFVGINFNVVADRIGGENADDGTRTQPFFINDAAQQRAGVVVEFLRFGAHHRVFQYFWKSASQFPGLKKW